VAGAVLQEAIDLAAIMNALRALGGYRNGQPKPGAEVELSGRFRQEHVELSPIIDRVRTLADRLDTLGKAQSQIDLRDVLAFLEQKLLPHEDAEEKLLYPAMARVLGGEDPTETMSRAHVEIVHLVRLLRRQVEESEPNGPESEDLEGLRRVLYSLHAVLKLHFAQEEEAYLSRPDDPVAATRQTREHRGR
jgi:hemerythrin-like domain-containing protein